MFSSKLLSCGQTAVVEMNSLSLLKDELRKVPDQSAVMLVNAGLSDLSAALLRDASELREAEDLPSRHHGGRRATG